jgi:hypothetical protein
VNNPPCNECSKRSLACTYRAQKKTRQQRCNQCTQGHRSCSFSTKRKGEASRSQAMRILILATATEIESSDDEAKSPSDIGSPSKSYNTGKQIARPGSLTTEFSADPAEWSTAQTSSPRSEFPSSDAEMRVDQGASTSTSAVVGAFRPHSGRPLVVARETYRPPPLTPGGSTSQSGQTTETDEDVRPRLEEPPLPPPRLRTALGQKRAKFERLREARDAFFEKMHALTASEHPDLGEEALDELYVLAMTWRTHEDLAWPTELK